MFLAAKSLSIPTLMLLFLVLVSTKPVFAQQPSPTGADYQDIAARIISAGQESNNSFLKLQELCDDIGHRLSGSEELDQAIEWAQATMKADGQENVRAEKVMVTKWVRGNESCALVEPRPLNLPMLGLGGSVGTPPEGITAEVVVVANKDELDALPVETVQGKILVFNCVMPQFTDSVGSGYGETVQYRSNGAKWGAEKGAVAVLVRSVTARSLQTPHTGAMRYGTAATKIPAASITIEGAELLSRFQARGKKIVVTLKMEAETVGEVPSANVLAEIVGSEKPEEIVVIGGHIDSWDVGQGAHDDGAGCVAAMEALNILRKLDLRPRRTIRVVLWTNEENGVAGGNAYVALHQKEVHVAGIESDSGGFAPTGIDVEFLDDRKEDLAAEQLGEILAHLKPINATVARKGHSGVDIGLLKILGTPCMGLRVDGSKYFDTHHTWADTVDKVDPEELSHCSITLAVAAYVLADMPGRLGEK
jgi:carboxypeptidase Q